MKSLFWIGCFLSRALLVLFILTSGVGLMPDEAQYWTWSLFPDFGYYSKPPGIAWQIWMGTHIFGMNELGVRFISLLLPIPMALFIKGIVNVLTSNPSVAYLTGLAFLLSPLGMSASLIATTDGGMLLFGLGTIYFYLKSSSHTQAGIFIALGALWKWMTYVLLLPLLIYELIMKQFKIAPFLWMCLISLLGLIPALLWNINHDFATFRHVEGTILNTHTAHAAANPVAFFLAAITLVSPGFFLLALPALFSMKKERALLLRLLVLFIFGGILLMSCFRKVQGNWGVLGLVFLFPLMGCFLATTKKKWFLPAAILVSLLLQGIFLGNFLKRSPLQHGMGMEKISDALIQSGYTPQHFLFSDRYQTVSLVWFYGPEQKKTYFFNISNLRHNQFCFWPGMEKECVRKSGFYVALVPSAEKSSLSVRAHHMQKKLKEYFAHVGRPKIYPLRSSNTISNYLLIIPARKYSGMTPEQKETY